MKTNIDKLVKLKVMGQIHHPTSGGTRIDHKGVAFTEPGVGGIVYNFKIGDSCMGIAGDHVEPGVSLRNLKDNENWGLVRFACIGNEAVVVSGDAKGAVGSVTGKHGGAYHTMIYFDEATLEKLEIDDKISIKSYGQGLKLIDHKDVDVLNIDPWLFDALGISENAGAVQVPYRLEVPAELMGSGLGSNSMYDGDYDIMLSDEKETKRLGLDKLCFGDIVLIKDHYCGFGPVFQKGALTFGVIIHADCYTAGHGPGVTPILTTRNGKLLGVKREDANIAKHIVPKISKRMKEVEAANEAAKKKPQKDE